MLKNRKIGQKIAILTFISLLAILVSGISSYRAMNQMNTNSVSMYKNQMKPVQWLGTVRADNNAINADMLELLLSPDKKYKRNY